MNKPTWKEILYANHHFGMSVNNFIDVAERLGYPFICWNGQILRKVTDRKWIEWWATKWKEEDIPE